MHADVPGQPPHTFTYCMNNASHHHDLMSYAEKDVPRLLSRHFNLTNRFGAPGPERGSTW